MKFSKLNDFELACGVVITVVLDKEVHDELVTLTGVFLGDIQEKHHHKKFDLHEFILIQLTCPFCEKGGLEIPAGTFCTINVDQILFITSGIKCHEMHDDKCNDNWCDKCHNKKHIINIDCNRDVERNDVKCDET